jgi:hypothetical protein
MKELSVDLEVIIINLISQIPMSIWLYNDGRSMGTSTTTRLKWQSLCGKMTTKGRNTEWISIMTMNQTRRRVDRRYGLL